MRPIDGVECDGNTTDIGRIVCVTLAGISTLPCIPGDVVKHKKLPPALLAIVCFDTN